VRIDDSLCEPEAFSAIRLSSHDKSTPRAETNDPSRYLAMCRAKRRAIISCDWAGQLETVSGVMQGTF
jgi:hypothetical protein